MKAIRSAVKHVGDFRRAYFIINLTYYGVILGAMAVTILKPSFQQFLRDAIGHAVKEGPLAPVGNAYLGGHLVTAFLLTFFINLLGGSFVSITLPSLVIPFSGLLVGAYRAILWGFIFAPTSLEMTPAKITMGGLIAILLFLEGQGYVLTMLAAYIQGRLFLAPQAIGMASHWRGYWTGLKWSLQIYFLVAIVLAVAAAYEVVLGVLIAPQLR